MGTFGNFPGRFARYGRYHGVSKPFVYWFVECPLAHRVRGRAELGTVPRDEGP